MLAPNEFLVPVIGLGPMVEWNFLKISLFTASACIGLLFMDHGPWCRLYRPHDLQEIFLLPIKFKVLRGLFVS